MGALAPRALAQAQNVFLWEGFERAAAELRWSVDSANDPAELAADREHVTQGQRSLRVEARFGPQKRVLVRRSARLRLRGLTRLLADVRCAGEGLRFSFAYKDAQHRWHEGPPVALRQGWNRDVGCRVSALKPRGPAGDADPAEEVREFYLVLHSGVSGPATVHVDNLRFEGEPSGHWNLTPPTDIEVYQPARSVGRWEKFEVGVQFQGTYGNLFNPDDVLVEAVFTDPDGGRHLARGFFAGYANSERFGPGWPIFLVRFAPTQVGRWTFVVRVRNAEGESAERPRWFYATDSSSEGFVRVSKDDPRFFELDSGRFFYPIGQNVAWAQEYEPYFERQRQTGQNWVRIWLCPWHLQLEKKAGAYDMEAARRLDRIVELAASHGLRIQLVLVHHGMLTGESWHENPYSWYNDGPCYLASEFFTSPEARRLFKRRLDYIVARWGFSTTIFAWELFNEVDLTRYSTFEDVVRWHAEMSSYLKQIDPNRHLVTTSLSRECTDTRLWELPDIDFTQAHIYGRDVAGRVLERHVAAQALGKPFFVGEYGRGTTGLEAQQDRFGRELRDAFWATFMLPAAGNAMPWWWDSLIRPHNLERFFKPLARFAEGMDRRAQNFRLIETAMLEGNGAEIAVRGLLNNWSCYLWLHRRRPDLAGVGGPPLIPHGKEFALSGMLGGKYLLTVMDTASGRILRRSALDCERGRLIVSLPRCEQDVAVKVEYQGAPTPRFHASPEFLRLESTLPPGAH